MSKCPYFKKCGACRYDPSDYEASLTVKRKKMTELFAFPFVMEKMDDPYHSRYKVIYSFYMDKGVLKAGLYRKESHRVIGLDECVLQSQIANAILKDLIALADSFKLIAYDEDRRLGLLRHVQIRVSRYDQKALITLVLADKRFPSSRNFIKALIKSHPEIIGVVFNFNSRHTSVVLGSEERIVYGKGFLYDRMGDLKFGISSRSFYQVNPVMAEKIYRDVAELGGFQADDTVLDAYCGTGTIGQFIAGSVREVVGIEINAEAVKNALANARTNNIDNIRFIQADATEALKSGYYDVVITDPPRSGMSKAFIDGLLALKPRKIIYVSCEPLTLQRDLKQLEKLYQLKKLKFYDQFVFSSHLEALTVLQITKSR